MKFLLTSNYSKHIMSQIIREGANTAYLSRTFIPWEVVLGYSGIYHRDGGM